MLPKSLVIAILSGVAASSALGAYFMKLDAEQYEVQFVDGPSVSVMVEKRDHKLGEMIRIMLINSGTIPIEFSEGPPSLQIRALDGTVFLSTTFDLKGLSPREQYAFEWNQQKDDGSRVLEGRYVIAVSAYDENKQRLDDRLTVNIHK